MNLGANTTSAGSSYTIISGGAGSAISQISAANINVDSSGSNKSGSLVFTTAVLGDNLILNVANNSNPSFVTNSNQLEIYSAISSANAATGELAILQNYANNNTVSDSQKTAAIKSALPETDNSVNRISFNNASATANIITERVSFVQNITTQYKLTAPNSVAGISSGEKPKTDNLWIQTFGSQVKQSSTAQGEGYNASSVGLALGADTKISKDTLVGISLGYANSNVKSQTKLQNTKIDSYQLNLYSGYVQKDYFVNTVIGATWNEYEAQRAIPVAGVTAKANYSGQSYMARAEVGKQNRLGNNFLLTPKVMITAAHNTTTTIAKMALARLI